jgi:hypothetical protein
LERSTREGVDQVLLGFLIAGVLLEVADVVDLTGSESAPDGEALGVILLIELGADEVAAAVDGRIDGRVKEANVCGSKK